MNKLFRPKCMRRMAVFMALVAPIVYLFGSLFFALNGAHGQEVFAEPVYTQDYVEVGGFDSEGYYRLDILDGDYVRAFGVGSNRNVDFDFSYAGNEFEAFRIVSNASLRFLVDSSDPNSAAYIIDSYSLIVPSPVSVYFEWSIDLPLNSSAKLFKLFDVPSSVVPENSGAYSDYIFKNFFAKDNFLVQWGKNAISENPYGFAPFGYFWRYLDTNVLHMSNEQVGLMAYGYMYYAAHVLLFDVGFILVTFFLTFIQKVADKIGGEDHA